MWNFNDFWCFFHKRWRTSRKIYKMPENLLCSWFPFQLPNFIFWMNRFSGEFLWKIFSKNRKQFFLHVYSEKKIGEILFFYWIIFSRIKYSRSNHILWATRLCNALWFLLENYAVILEVLYWWILSLWKVCRLINFVLNQNFYYSGYVRIKFLWKLKKAM